jgi:poly-gamma-glutamate capsule biosynthesis protein CapA/YwtB (metallophosphatase superfamily)
MVITYYMKKYFKAIGLIFLVLITLESCVSTNKTDKNHVIIGFAGDVMIGRLVNKIIQEKGYSYPWGNSLSLLAQADLRIINLETTLTNYTKETPKVFNFRALPDRVKTLQNAHIDVVNLANNHSLDFQENGLAETIATLDSAGIQHVGAGINIHSARKPVIITKNGIKIGIIGYTDNEPTWKASEDKPGTNYINVGDVQNIKKQITTLRPLVDIVIVTNHWGPNMEQVPSPDFVEFAHNIIDSGADIIHGHSSHVFQGIEIYQNKIIMYDTGDFIDDYAVDPKLRNDQSFFFTVTVSKNSPISATLTPVIIKDMQVNIADGAEKEEIIGRMQQLSQQFNTKITDDGMINIEPVQ